MSIVPEVFSNGSKRLRVAAGARLLRVRMSLSPDSSTATLTSGADSCVCMNL
jgi:hypothetical protein